MKKILIAILLTFGFIANVNAAYKIEQVENSQEYFIGGGSCPGCYKQKDDIVSNSMPTIPYNINYNGKYYAAFCLDPNLDEGDSYDIKSTISGNTTDKYYAGLYAIVTHKKAFYSDNMTEGNVADKMGYVETNLALRMWKVANGLGIRNSLTYGGTPAYLDIIAKETAVAMSENASIAKTATGYDCTSAECFYKKMYNHGTYSSISLLKSDAISHLNVAKEMFVAALTAAANVSNGTTATSTATSDVGSSTYSLSTKDNSTKDKFIQYDYFDISVNNFTSENYIEGLSVSCNNCSSIGANPSISVSYSINNGTSWVEGVPTNESLKSVTGTTKIILKVKTTIDANAGFNCEKININISYKYNAPTSDKSVLFLQGKSNQLVQDFVVIVPASDVVSPVGGNDDSLTPVSKDFDIDFCGENPCAYKDPKDFEQMTEEEFEDYTDKCCTDVEGYCADSNNANQQYYCDLYDEYCGACDTVIEVPNACQLTEDGEESEVSIESTTGYVKSAVDDEGNENIKACLLMRKKDEAGHSYKVMENDYCKVFCKEDFTFELPGLKKLNSGTYFQLEATITGTKSCYTSEIKPLDSTDEDKIKQYNACVNMEVDYSCFDPVIDYEYDEIYNDQLGENNKFVNVGDVAETNKKNTYCYGDINDDYSCTGESSNTLIAGKEVKYIKSTVTKTGIYKTPSVFYTQHPSGTITTKPDATNATLINGLPVSLSTAQGRHQFKLRLQNIGEYYDTTSCDNGRLIGDENSILNKQNKDLGNNGIMKAEYMCYYDINCPECEFDCEGPLCEIEPTDCGGKECDVACLGNGCAYNNGLSYAYRTVSLNALNPNNGEGRKLGYNWDASKSPKVAETIKEIEANGENAYDEPEYSFTLTPAVISAIKTYNKTKLNNGGYVDESLKCNEEGINCESKFISDLQTGASGLPKAKVTVPENKFTSWLDSEYCKGTCTIKKLSGIGPSWK